MSTIRRRWEGGQLIEEQVVESRVSTGREAALAKVMSSVNERIQFQVDQKTRHEWVEQPTLYAGQKLVKPLGGNELRPRGFQATSGIQAGDPVQASQGVISGTPGFGQTWRDPLQKVVNSLSQVALERGMQVAEIEDPNDAPDPATGDPTGSPVGARYPYDAFWSLAKQSLWYWKPSTTAEAGEWLEILTAGGLQFGEQDPTTEGLSAGRFDNDLYWSNVHFTLFQWVITDDTTDPPTGEWVARLQQAQGDGTPADVGINGFVRGGTYHDGSEDKNYYWNGFEWKPVGSGSTVLIGNYDPNESAEDWVEGGFFFDGRAERLFIAKPADYWQIDYDWLPAGSKGFDANAYSYYPYPGDTYQAPNGTFYMLDDSFTWQMQWYCPDCEEDPDDSSSGDSPDIYWCDGVQIGNGCY